MIMRITVTMLGGLTRHFDVSPTDTVGSLKLRIQNEMGIPVENQKLVIVNGCRTDLSDNTKPLSYYGVQSGSRVNLLQVTPETFQVFLKNEKGVTSTYDVKPTETVGDFKKRVQSREGVPANQMNLVYQSRAMSEDGLTLKDYGVQPLGTIEMMLRLRGG